MKKYLVILNLVVVSAFMGCSDQLDRFPNDSLVEETAYNTVTDLQYGLNGVIGSYGFNYIIGFNSIFTDNTILGVDNGGQDVNFHNQILNSDTGTFSFTTGGILWNSRYANINDMNRLLASSQTITPAVDEVDTYNNILAQTYAFRAFAHYELLLYYGLDLTDDSALGVPYVDYVSADATPGRNTVGEVVTAINDDLDRALDLFPAGTNDINFATPDFVTFLRARLALETGDNPGAIAYASDLIPSYPLADTSQYFAMFNEDADKTEVVFNYDNVQGSDWGINFAWNFSGQGPKFEISRDLYASYADDDIRKTVILDNVSTDEVLVVGKYPINADANAINDFKAMRISEMYLIRAEAYAKTTQFDLAEADVNAVRAARHSGTPDLVDYNSLGEAIDGIIEERRLELAFEGHRYTDIKRVRSITNRGIERAEDLGDCESPAPCVMPATSNKFILPIPQGEINANPILREQQAPGY